MVSFDPTWQLVILIKVSLEKRIEILITAVQPEEMIKSHMPMMAVFYHIQLTILEFTSKIHPSKFRKYVDYYQEIAIAEKLSEEQQLLNSLLGLKKVESSIR
jgi:hypothetical protein